MTKKRCIVTGHRGYIGSKVYQALVSRDDCEVIGLDSLDIGNNNLLSIFFADGDKDTRRRRLKDFDPHYIFHLAAIPRVGASIETPFLTMYNNVLSTSLLLRFAKNCPNLKRFIYSSSSSVKGNGTGPISPYAVQKLASEMETTVYSSIYGIDTVSLRYFNVYSADQAADGSYATAVSNWMHHIREGKTPFITGDGTQRRDMLHVADAVRANLFAMDREDRFNGAVYDVGTGTNISLLELKDIVLSHFPEVEFEMKEDRKGDVRETLAETKPLEDLGFKVEVSLESGLDECFKLLAAEMRSKIESD